MFDPAVFWESLTCGQLNRMVVYLPEELMSDAYGKSVKPIWRAPNILAFEQFIKQAVFSGWAHVGVDAACLQTCLFLPECGLVKKDEKDKETFRNHESCPSLTSFVI